VLDKNTFSPNDYNEAYQMEEQIKQLGLAVLYVGTLYDILNEDREDKTTWVGHFELAHATYEQRGRAARKILEDKGMI
jgi:hypothetical protein